MSEKNQDTNGNAYQSALDFQKAILKIGEALVRCTSYNERNGDVGTYLKGFTIKAPEQGRGEWFVIIRAVIEGSHVVAFNSGDTLEEVMKGSCNKYVYGHLKWRIDQYAE